MYLFEVFRSYQPSPNPIGFGPADFFELGFAILLFFTALVWRPWLEPRVERLAGGRVLCFALLAAAPVVLRLALLANHPVPSPDVYDEFGHLLVADTLRHFRLANPMHPMRQFFETFFVLQEPTYSSIYPIGQGLAMAIGRAIFRIPWAGVVLSTAAFCSLCYWMLRGWTTPRWALAGGILAVFEFGPLSPWMNSYWGGSFAAAGGCLVFGALPRLLERWQTRDAVLLGLGIAINLLTRPYESVFLLLSVVLFVAPVAPNREAWRSLGKAALVAGLVAVPALAITLIQNKAVTGNWTMLPYSLSQYQYGVPAALTFQPNPVPHRQLTPQQALDYKMQSLFRGSGPETLGSYLLRLEYRVRFYRFFFLPALYVALLAFLPALREYRYAWVALTVLLFALGINFFPAFQLHYLAAVTCLFVLMSVTGLERLSRWSGDAARLVFLVCTVHFVFWYTLHVFDNSGVSMAMRRYETWDAISHGNPERRILINTQLSKLPGQQLVFVRYSPQHIFQDEWVYNEADIDAARVVWARDLGAEENEKLRQYYPKRTAWLLEPDMRPPQLTPYQP
jgi:hypothetical protein